MNMASKKYAMADKKQCVACGVCVKECPMNAISIWKGCYAVIDKISALVVENVLKHVRLTTSQ